MIEAHSILDKIGSALTGWVAFVAVVWPFFEVGERLASTELRKKTTQWLKTVNSSSVPTWPGTVIALLNRVMGDRYISWRAFGRSCISSTVAVSALALVWQNVFEKYSKNSALEAYGHIIPFAVALNLIPDFLALIKTRYILNWMTKQPTLLRRLLFFAADVALSLGIALLGLYMMWTTLFVFLYFAGVVSDNLASYINFVNDVFWKALTLNDGFAVFLYSTLLTSVWIWLYVLGGSLYRITDWSRSGVHWMSWMLDIKKQPIRSIGFIATAAFTIVYWLGAWIVWLT